MNLRWYIIPNNDPEDNSPDQKKLQMFFCGKDGQSESEAFNDESNWEDIPEVYADWRKK